MEQLNLLKYRANACRLSAENFFFENEACQVVKYLFKVSPKSVNFYLKFNA